MNETVILELPQETVDRYRRSAVAAHKSVEEFLAERIVWGTPPEIEDVPLSVQEEVDGLVDLSDEQLWEIARSQVPLGKQRIYTRLLNKNSDGTINDREREKLRTLGDEARQLTLRKAQAYVLLRFRGYPLPTRADLIRGG